MTGTPSPRPRVEGEREQEILDATLTVLLDVGYDKLTFDLVSAAARVSKATLYRKWANKEDLVMSAVTNASACTLSSAPLPHTGSLAEDLSALRHRSDTARSAMPDVVGAIAPALLRDEALRERFIADFIEPRIDRFRRILLRAQERGEIATVLDTELLAHIVPAFALQHLILQGRGPSPDFILHVIDDVLLPAAGITTPTPLTPEGGAHVDGSHP